MAEDGNRLIEVMLVCGECDVHLFCQWTSSVAIEPLFVSETRTFFEEVPRGSNTFSILLTRSIPFTV
jgi:hypothetical protein